MREHLSATAYTCRVLNRPARSTAKLAAAGTLGGYGLLLGEALLTRKRIGTTSRRPPSADGVYGDELPGAPVRTLVLGDSTAVGYGMESADHTPPALAAIGLAHLLDRPIDMRSVAKVGARSSDLMEQIGQAIDHRPQLVFILIGANDVTHQVRPATAGRRLARAVRVLRENGAEVIVGTCPDLGTVKQMPQPLRQVARLYSRRLARAQTSHALHAGARCVSLADQLGPLFEIKGDHLFGADRFHPSETGYATVVGFLVAAGAVAWREREVDQPAWSGAPREFMSIDDAATEAAEHGGTQVVPTPGGRRAFVLRRR